MAQKDRAHSSKKYSPTQLLGLKGEKMALDFLLTKKLICISQNFFTPFGEIDLIMKDEQTLVFVEVRLRQESQLAKSCETITVSKQKKIIRSAYFYLQKHPTPHACRFDVIAIQNKLIQQEIYWIKDAFQV